VNGESGALPDRLGKRKLLAGIGYGLAALTKPMFPLTTTAGEVLAARFIDRIGKGIRGTPCDALIADVTPREVRGAAYGVRQALDTVGGFGGPLLAMILMALYANNFRAVFWWALVPAVLCVLLIIFGVQEPDGIKRTDQRGWPINRAELARSQRATGWSSVSASTSPWPASARHSWCSRRKAPVWRLHRSRSCTCG
jgi:MFS family permease